MIVINELVWDEYNLNHIQKHNVTQIEILEASQQLESVLMGKKGRLVVIGRTKKKRVITFILDKKEENKYYLVTARNISRVERRIINEKSDKK